MTRERLEAAEHVELVKVKVVDGQPTYSVYCHICQATITEPGHRAQWVSRKRANHHKWRHIRLHYRFQRITERS
jgi:hypothetical protein